MSFIDLNAEHEVLTDDDFAVLDLRSVPADERCALANILQQAINRLGGAGWSQEREDAAMRELLRTHMRGLIGDAASGVKAGATSIDPGGEAA